MVVTKKDLEVKIGNYTFPSALAGTYKVIKQKYNAYAERAGKSMRIDQLGDVWTLEFTLPSLPQSEYKKIADALDPFVVDVSYYNDWTGERRVDRFYHNDLEAVRLSLELHMPITIKFIGTEVLE